MVINSLKINRINANNQEVTHDSVIVEKLFCLDVENVVQFTLFCTPNDLEALAIGTLFEKRIIEDKDDVECLEIFAGVIRVKVRDHSLSAKKYIKFLQYANVGCETERLFANIKPNQKRLEKIEFSQIVEAMATLQERQEIFRQTGAAHAALIFNAGGEYLAFAEDIGRHNALDKVIGKCILAERSSAGCALALSSRISYEMVAKAARAGVELVAAVSAPSSLAVAAAKYWQMTLCGFVRGEKANVYCGMDRVTSCS